MKVILKPNMSGKTTELIKQSGKEWKYIVCISRDEATRIQGQSIKLKIDIPFPITFHEFIKGDYYPHGIKGFLLDNVDMWLQSLSSVKIDTITLTEDKVIN